jgi:hypothetical protein
MSTPRGFSGYGSQWFICDIGYSSDAVCTDTSNRLEGMCMMEAFLVFDTKRLFLVFWSSFEFGALRRHRQQ